MSSKLASNELLQNLQSQAVNVGDLPQVPETPDRLRLYSDLINVGSLLAVYGNIFTDKIRQDRGDASITSISDFGFQWYQDYVNGMYQAITGPLSSYFKLSSMMNGQASQQIDLTEVNQLRITEVFEDVVGFFGKFTSGKTELKKLLAKFANSTISIDLSDPASSLPRESTCIKMNVLVKETLSGSVKPVDEDDEIYQPTLKVAYVDIKLERLESSARDRCEKDVGSALLQLKTQFRMFDAVLDAESYQGDKPRLDATLQEIIKKNWDKELAPQKGEAN